jgi:multiple sugar transport system permease protein
VRQPRAERRRRLVALGMLAPVLAGLGVFFVYPLVASVIYSFTRYNQLQSPEFVGLLNYRFLFTDDPQIGVAALNTLWFVVILVPVRMVSALAVAGLLSRARVASGIWRTLFYLPSLVPSVAGVVAFVFLFNPGTGPVNQLLRLAGIKGPLWFNDPGWSKPSLVILGVWVMGDIMIIFLAALLDVPKELYEAADLDGANGPRKIRHVTLPTISPVLGFAGVTGVLAGGGGVAGGRGGSSGCSPPRFSTSRRQPLPPGSPVARQLSVGALRGASGTQALRFSPTPRFFTCADSPASSSDTPPRWLWCCS